MSRGPSDVGPVGLVLAVWVGFTALIASLVVLLPLRLEELGYGVDAIAAVVGAAGVGGVLSADVVGRAGDRWGPQRMLRGGLIVMIACMVGLGFARTLVPLVLLHAVVGVATAAVRLGSQVAVRRGIAPDRRGRMHAIQGTATRVTMLVGPVAAGVLWERVAPAWSFVLPALIAGFLLLWSRHVDLEWTPARRVRAPASIAWARLLRVSSGPLLFNAARSGRFLLLPLFGLELGLSPARIGLLVAVSTGIDLAVSPVSGRLMDGRGRLTTIVPAFSLMALGFVVLAASSTTWMVVVAAAILGVGNGLSAGLLLTLGTDLAPDDAEGPFLGRFGALGDAGRLIGPFLVGSLGDTFGLETAATSLALITVLALALVFVFIGETKPTVAADIE